MIRIILALSVLSFTQMSGQVHTEPTRVDTPISYVSKGSDTLYLVDDNLGKMIASTWDGKYYILERDGRKPEIVLTTQHYILNRYGLIRKTPAKKIMAKNQFKK